ncbi:MAG: NADPH-dependent glutamate synthase [Anaerolineae bacterium]|nr:NADPH-dependent glutamate synthase [Anaerolineae bacterium]
MKPRDLPRQEMPEQDPIVRRHNFEEVALGYTAEMAQLEAERCLQCRRPGCIEGCPVEVPIPEFIHALCRGDMPEASRILKSRNNLPAICGRVCPQETQCEMTCVLARRGQPIAVGRLERFVADWERQYGVQSVEIAPPTGRSVAVVGSGPAGLTAAADLARAGHSVVIYESLHRPGGVLMYGIPEFRLPKDVVDAEVQFVQSLGVEIRLNSVVGRLYTIDELLREHDAVFLGTGAGLPMWMGIPGENLNGVFSANEFLTRVNLMKAYLFPEYDTPVYVGRRVAVIGAGNVALDAARTALRLGADDVRIVYRRSAQEMPARAEEVHHARAEGIAFDFLATPIMIHGDEKQKVTGMRNVRMQLGEPGPDGRRVCYPLEGTEFDMEVDMVIMALGTRPNPLVFSEAAGLERSRRGTVEADPTTGRTTRERVWAGGDVTTGSATVISAMGAGKRAAADIDAYLSAVSPVWAGAEEIVR